MTRLQSIRDLVRDFSICGDTQPCRSLCAVSAIVVFFCCYGQSVGQSAETKGQHSVMEALQKAVKQSRESKECGLDLSKPGAGILPITNASLFDKYPKVFYLPKPALKIVESPSKDTKMLLLVASRSPDKFRAKFARVCLAIVESTDKVIRTHLENPFIGKCNKRFPHYIVHYK